MEVTLNLNTQILVVKNLIYTNMTCFPECKEFAKF